MNGGFELPTKPYMQVRVTVKSFQFEIVIPITNQDRGLHAIADEIEREIRDRIVEEVERQYPEYTMKLIR